MQAWEAKRMALKRALALVLLWCGCQLGKGDSEHLLQPIRGFLPPVVVFSDVASASSPQLLQHRVALSKQIPQPASLVSVLVSHSPQEHATYHPRFYQILLNADAKQAALVQGGKALFQVLAESEVDGAGSVFKKVAPLLPPTWILVHWWV